MWSPVIIIVDPAAYLLPGFPATTEGLQVNSFTFEAAPEAFNKHIVHPACLAIHGDTDTSILQLADPERTRELATLIRVEDIRLAVALHSVFKGFSIHAVADPPA